jgi:hypothetical protein
MNSAIIIIAYLVAMPVFHVTNKQRFQGGDDYFGFDLIFIKIIIIKLNFFLKNQTSSWFWFGSIGFLR